MKEAVTKVINTLTRDGALKKLLERYNKCIAAGRDYFERDYSFICVLPIKVPIRKKSGNLSYAPRTFAKGALLLCTLVQIAAVAVHLNLKS